jgi:hypothetical protein
MSYTVFSAFELIALIRYTGDVDWTKPQAWIYVLFLVSVLLVGVYGWRRSSREAAIHNVVASRAT